MMKFFLSRIFVTIFFVILIMTSVAYYLLFTRAGISFIVDKIFPYYLKESQVQIENIKGNLVRGTIFENIEVVNVRGCPEGTVLKVKRVFLNIISFTVKGLNIKIENARLFLPESDPIVLFGSLNQGIIDSNIFTNNFDIDQIIPFLSKSIVLPNILMSLGPMDLYINGFYLEPIIKGSWKVHKVVKEDVSFTNGVGEFLIQLKDIKKDLKIYGHVFIEEGDILAKKTKMSLKDSIIRFAGSPHLVDLNIKGKSKIEGVEIFIKLRGSLKEPLLDLTSKPSLSEEKLLIMLATGKRWKGLENVYEEKNITPDLAKDFIDYFIFAGKGQKFAEKLGITDITVQYNEDVKSVGVTKEVTKKLDVGYELEQTSQQQENQEVHHKIQGVYKVTDKISVGVEKELKKQGHNDASIDETEGETMEDKLFLKFDTKF